ncbi:hypothetical protein NYE55_37570 [Bacillus sp. FSL R12-0069]
MYLTTYVALNMFDSTLSFIQANNLEQAFENLKHSSFDLEKTWRIHDISCYSKKDAMIISAHTKSDNNYVRYLIMSKRKWDEEKGKFQTVFREISYHNK